MNSYPLILASTSPYRRRLLERLGVPFQSIAPALDEDQEKDFSLSPQFFAEKLARLKAHSLCPQPAIVIGSDQVVHFEGKILGKPKTQINALSQLMSMRGKTHELLTSVCIVHPQGKEALTTDVTRVTFQNFSAEQANRVIQKDNPIDCAGAYKIESFGISLVKKIETQDFTAIEGLPLLWVSHKLNEMGVLCPPKS